jgi:hypothetical protein
LVQNLHVQETRGETCWQSCTLGLGIWVACISLTTTKGDQHIRLFCNLGILVVLPVTDMRFTLCKQNVWKNWREWSGAIDWPRHLPRHQIHPCQHLLPDHPHSHSLLIILADQRCISIDRSPSSRTMRLANGLKTYLELYLHNQLKRPRSHLDGRWIDV